jgi:hypothetical protein
MAEKLPHQKHNFTDEEMHTLTQLRPMMGGPMTRIKRSRNICSIYSKSGVKRAKPRCMRRRPAVHRHAAEARPTVAITTSLHSAPASRSCPPAHLEQLKPGKPAALAR